MSARARPRWRADAAACTFLVLLGGLLLAPALVHGASIGPTDVMRELGLTSRVAPQVHNPVGSDEIEEFMPWQLLAWQQVHAGHWPIWNPFSVLGMPLAFNVESAPFSLPVALSYAFPAFLTHTVAIAARLLIGGTGMYVLGRVIGLDPLAAVFGASVFELSGAYTIWLGAYESGVLGFTGYVLAASVLVARQARRARAIALLAVALALAFLGGEPQIALILVVGLALFAGVFALAARRHGPPGRARRIVVDHLLGVLAGAGLVAPVYLPATQLGLLSARATSPGISNLPLYDLTHLMLAGYNGVPTDVNDIIGPNNLYVSMVYVGVIALALGAAAFAHRQRRIEVLAAAAMAAGLTVVLFVPLVPDALAHVPVLRVFRLDLATPMLDGALALLAALGADALLRADPAWRRWPPSPDVVLLGAALLLAGALAVLGARLALNVDHLDAAQAALRGRSFLWPSLSLAALFAVVTARARARGGGTGALRRALARRAGIVVLLGTECAFLLLAGQGPISSAPAPLPRSVAVVRLQRLVGKGLVGIGRCAENAFPDAGVLPDANVAYGLAQLSVYDPIVPAAYYRSYGAAAGTTRAVLWPHVFCPQITSARLARLYGVSDILEPPGAPAPAGTSYVATIHGERLYSVPGSGRATLSVAGRASVVTARQPAPGTWRIVLDARRAGTLELRITDVPGWRATLDGRALALESFHQVMLAARVPAGRHVVVLTYWPRLLSVGLALAALAALGLAIGLVAEAARARRTRHVAGEGDCAGPAAGSAS